jgi:signal transduction histidine kinase
VASQAADALLETAAAFAEHVSQRTEREMVLTEGAELVVSALEVDAGSVWRVRPDISLELIAFVPGDSTHQPSFEPLAETPLGNAVITRSAVVSDDFRKQDDLTESPFLAARGLHSGMLVPIFWSQHVVGVLGAHSRQPRRFQQFELAFVRIIASAMAPAVGGEEGLAERQKHLMRAEQMIALGQVAAGVAHELRNPLTAVKGLVQVNRKELLERDFPVDDLQIIELEIRRMERSLQNFLDFARPPQPRRQRFSLGLVVRRVLSLVHGRAQKQRVSFELTHSVKNDLVDADQDMIQQVLLNLVLNALDAMPDGGTIRIDWKRSSTRHLSIRVCDSGPGIAPHILPVVFDQFVSSKETGVGLGLPVSRRIAELHGGTLSAENPPGGGAAFTLELPGAMDEPQEFPGESADAPLADR